MAVKMGATHTYPCSRPFTGREPGGGRDGVHTAPNKRQGNYRPAPRPEGSSRARQSPPQRPPRVEGNTPTHASEVVPQVLGVLPPTLFGVLPQQTVGQWAITVLLRGAKGTLERGNRLRRPFRVRRRLRERECV